MTKKILLYGINFSPELTGIGKYTGELAAWLAARGHDVRVVTAPPYYPDWKVGAGFKNGWAVEDIRGEGAAPTNTATPAPVGAAPSPRMNPVGAAPPPRMNPVGAAPPPRMNPVGAAPPPRMNPVGAAPSPRMNPVGAAKVNGGSLQVYRCPLWVPAQPGGVKRLLHLASFALSSLPIMLRQLLWRPDVVWVVEPALFCAPTAVVVARLCGAKAWLHVQDFEVDAAYSLGLLRGAGLRRLVTGAERWLMRRFDVVSTISQRMHQRLLDKGVTPAKTRMAVNWVNMAEFALPSAEGVAAYRRELSIPDDAVVALYSGNMGAKQGLEVLADVARLCLAARQEADVARLCLAARQDSLRGEGATPTNTGAPDPVGAAPPPRMTTNTAAPDPVGAAPPPRMTTNTPAPDPVGAAPPPRRYSELVFVFCGNGAGRADLVARCQGLPNVQFMDLQPANRLPDLLATADIHLLPQRADAADLVMPSKLTGMLASARPVVATAHAGTELAMVVGGGGARLDSACGLVVPSDDAVAFAAALQTLALDAPLREQLGAAGFLYAQEHLDREAVLQKFEADVLELVRN